MEGVVLALGRVQSRGQITLPRQVRQAAQIQPGDSVNIQAVGPGRIEVKVVRRLTLQDLLDRYPIDVPVNIAADRETWEEEAAKDAVEPDGP
jgi:AbrB family looped-hinge helix DNA binding protein